MLPSQLRVRARLTLALTLASCVSALAQPRQAQACSEPVCQNGFLVPSGAARVPANATGFWWRSSRDDGGDDLPVHVWQLVPLTGVVDGVVDPPVEGQPADGRLPLEVTRTVLTAEETDPGVWSAPGVLLGVGLVAGQHLVVDAPDTCAIGGRQPFSAQVEVTAAQPVPTRLGVLSASTPTHGPLTLASDGGGCSREADTVYVDVDLTLGPEAQPWADLLLYETLVDGAPYRPSASAIHTPPPHESWLGRGRDRVVVVCDPSASDVRGLTAGPHTVQLVARLPGSPVGVLSDTLDVTLTCPAPAVSPADELYDAVSFQMGALVVVGQLTLLLYVWMTRRTRRRRA